MSAQEMRTVELRVQAGAKSAGDLTLAVQEKTFDYLMTSPAPEIRVSAFLVKDEARVEAGYAELFVSEDCTFASKVTRIIPGSRTRKQIALPGPMSSGEQLTVLVKRTAPDEPV